MADFSLPLADISDDELMDFVISQENENTKKKTGHDIDIFRVFLRTVRGILEDTDIHDIPAEELNGHVASFIVNVRRRDGGEYEPCSFSAPWTGTFVVIVMAKHLWTVKSSVGTTMRWRPSKLTWKSRGKGTNLTELTLCLKRMLRNFFEQGSSEITAVRPSSTPCVCTAVCVLGCVGVLNTVSWDGAISSWKAMMQAVSFCNTMNGKPRQEQAGVFVLIIYIYIYLSSMTIFQCNRYSKLW